MPDLLDEIAAAERGETYAEMAKRLERERVHRLIDDMREQLGKARRHDKEGAQR